MYISSVKIKNFRNFDNIDIDFHEGVNVLIGHNNSGKSNLLRALSLILTVQLESNCQWKILITL